MKKHIIITLKYVDRMAPVLIENVLGVSKVTIDQKNNKQYTATIEAEDETILELILTGVKVISSVAGVEVLEDEAQAPAE